MSSSLDPVNMVLYMVKGHTLVIGKKQLREGRLHFGSQLNTTVHHNREGMDGGSRLRRLLTLHPQSGSTEAKISACFLICSPLRPPAMVLPIVKVGLPTMPGGLSPLCYESLES